MAEETSRNTEHISRLEREKIDRKVARMGSDSIPKLIVEFAVPAIVGMLVNGAYNIISSIFLGQAMGELGLSAVTVATPTMVIFMALSMLIGAGGNALAALRLGAGKKQEAEIVLGNTALLCIIMSLLIAILISIPLVLDTLITISSATDEVRPYAAEFIRILAYGFFFQCFGFGINNFIRTAGNPNRALVTMLIGAISCTIFSWLYVIEFGWGVPGAALATVSGQFMSFITVLWYFTRTKTAPFKLYLHNMHPMIRTIRSILFLGLASFFVQVGAAIVNFVINAMLLYYGAQTPIGAQDALASIGVVQRIAMFVVMPLIGISTAIQPLLGFNYGARNYRRVRTTLWYGIAAATLIGILLWALINTFPEEIISYFGIRNDHLREFTVFALSIQILLLPLVGFQIVGSNYFQATGQALKSSILSLTRQILFLVPCLFVLPVVLPPLTSSLTGLDAIYISTPVADGLAVCTVAVFLFFEMRRIRKLERSEQAHKPSVSGLAG